VPTKITTELWFVGVTCGGKPLTDAEVVRILHSVGCARVETLGTGTAQAQIPMAWVAQIEIHGSFRRSATLGDRNYVIDVDLP
jgi:hypothetical protein